MAVEAKRCCYKNGDGCTCAHWEKVWRERIEDKTYYTRPIETRWASTLTRNAWIEGTKNTDRRRTGVAFVEMD